MWLRAGCRQTCLERLLLPVFFILLHAFFHVQLRIQFSQPCAFGFQRLFLCKRLRKLLFCSLHLLFCIFLTFNPAKGGSLFVQVMGISLIFAGIENIIFTFYTSKRLKDIRNRLHDEWIALDEDNIID